MSTFTKEQLIARINQATAINKYRIGRDPAADGLAMDNELLAIALASIEAEAVGTFRKGTCGYSTSFHEDAVPLYAAPPAPVSMKDHQIRELVNELRDIAVEYHGTQQLRERIARTVRAAMLQSFGNSEQLEPVTTTYKLSDAVEALRNSGIAIDAEKIQEELDALNSPVIPDGYVLVPVEPTEDMIVEGFESEPDESFSDEKEWEAYDAMSGCQQAAHRAKLCWAAMIAAAPKPEVK